jgi:hypothetical protein
MFLLQCGSKKCDEKEQNPAAIQHQKYKIKV